MPKKPRQAAGRLSATLADVAREVQVSEITVSRVVRNKGAISSETRERVEAAIRKMGYVPNRLAGSLAVSGSDLIGVVVPTLRSIFPEILEGINSTIAAAGYRAVVGTTEFDQSEEEQLVTSLLSWRPAALIVAAYDHSPKTADQLKAAHHLLVEITDLDRAPIGVSIAMSHFEAGRRTAEFMIGKGHRRFGYVGHNINDDRYGLRRREGFASVLQEQGLAFIADNVVDRPYDYALGKAALADLLANAPPLDAVYFSNDAMAIGGYFHCLGAGIAVPEDLAIAGFNGLDVGQALPKPLTTVLSNRYQLGALAGRSALALISGEPVAPVTDVGFELIEGETA